MRIFCGSDAYLAAVKLLGASVVKADDQVSLGGDVYGCGLGLTLPHEQDPFSGKHAAGTVFAV